MKEFRIYAFENMKMQYELQSKKKINYLQGSENVIRLQNLKRKINFLDINLCFQDNKVCLTDHFF